MTLRGQRSLVSMVELLGVLCVVLSLIGEPTVVEVPGLERVLRVDEQLLVGSQPTPEGLAALADRGVRVVVSVDGMPPNLEALKKAGLRSVHLPIGYDGVPVERIHSLARLASEETGPIYIHCHHGRHRGPAAGALFWMMRSGATPEESRCILEKAGTSPSYQGLWKAVASFRPPVQGCADAPLPDRVEVTGMVGAMVEIDRARANLDRHLNAQPDIAPEHEVMILLEHFREMERLDPGGYAKRDADFRTQLVAARRATEALAAQKEVGQGQWMQALRALDASCTACHAAHRN